jgi:hypothetical protein
MPGVGLSVRIVFFFFFLVLRASSETKEEEPGMGNTEENGEYYSCRYYTYYIGVY